MSCLVITCMPTASHVIITSLALFTVHMYSMSLCTPEPSTCLAHAHALPFSLKRPAGCRPSTTTDQVHLPQIIMMRARSFPIRCNMYLRSNHPSHHSAGCRVSNAYNGVYPRTARPLLYSVLPSTTNYSPTIAEETDVCNGGPLDTCDDDQDVLLACCCCPSLLS